MESPRKTKSGRIFREFWCTRGRTTQICPPYLLAVNDSFRTEKVDLQRGPHANVPGEDSRRQLDVRAAVTAAKIREESYL